MRKPGLRRARGTALTETLIILPIFLMLALGAMQFSFIYEAKSTLNYATFMAARAGAVDHAQQDSISLALARSLAPLYSPDKNAAGLVRTIARVRGELSVFSQIRILNPTPEAFHDFAVRDPKTGQQEIPNEMLHVASTRVGGSSGVNIQDANLLKLQVLYGYKLQVPFVNKVITTITRWFTTDPVKLAYLTQGRLPILATSTVRMQSRAWKNGWMQAKKSVDDAVKAAEKPSSALPVASLKRPWASGPTGSGEPLGLTRIPGTGTGSGGTTVLAAGGSGTGSSRTDANKPGDAVAQPEGSGTALSEEKCINDKKWEGGFFGTLKSATRFFQGVVEGVVQQGKDILNTLRNLDGAWEGLKALAKSFIKDPVGTLQLIAENFADELKQDYRRLTECGPTDVGYLLGKHVNPAKLVKLGLRLTRFGGDLDKVRKVKCASFAAGTPVWTPKGAQPIETLPTEGLVLSRSDTEFSDRAQQITKTFGRQAPNYYVLRTEREAYRVTEEHPLWVQGKGWTPVKNIERGDAIATKDGDTLVRANTKVEEPLRVYNFSVANTPSYFVGTEGIWAHNAGKNCDVPGGKNDVGNYIPAPKDIDGIPGLIPAKPKTPVQAGGGLRKRWKDKKGNIYEWDSRHGTLEKYNKRGKHLGEFDPVTGKQTKPADKSRNVEP
jgi:hypothetical protein